MSPGLTVVDASVSWVPGTIVNVSNVGLIEVLSTWSCSGGWGGRCLVRWWVLEHYMARGGEGLGARCED
jgi:hypothetical protein